MLIDLLSANNYVSYNIKVAELLGLHSAIYLSELMNIQSKAGRKNKMTDNFFTLDRDYITSRTTISIQEQLDIEKNLISIGILETGETLNDLSLNITFLTTLMMTTDEKLIDNVKKSVNKQRKSQTKEAKNQAIKNNLKKNITTTNEELRDAYYEWIEEAFDKNGRLSKASVIHAQEVVDTFSQRNLDMALRLINIATRYGHREMDWAVDKYNNEYLVSYKVKAGASCARGEYTPKPVCVSEEVF